MDETPVAGKFLKLHFTDGCNASATDEPGTGTAGKRLVMEETQSAGKFLKLRSTVTKPGTAYCRRRGGLFRRNRGPCKLVCHAIASLVTSNHFIILYNDVHATDCLPFTCAAR
jgi:hypothetical protein